MPTVSVLIPCFNVDTTIDEALSSLKAQSLQDFEVVLVDDGSEDETLPHLHNWAGADPRFRVIALPHGGIIPALNAGLEACQSNIIARMDADDRSAPDRLQQQVDMLTAHPEIAVVSSLIRGFPEEKLGVEFREYINWLNELLTDDEIKQRMYLKSPLAHPSVAFRRTWVNQVGGYQDHGWAEDYDLWLRLFQAGAHFIKVPQVLLEWRDHPRRLTHTDGRYSEQSDLNLKAHYLMKGPLSTHDKVLIWGANHTARQLAAKLLELGSTILGFVATDNQIVGDLHLPLISPFEFDKTYQFQHPPCLLVIENDPRQKLDIMQQLAAHHLCQGIDWWEVG